MPQAPPRLTVSRLRRGVTLFLGFSLVGVVILLYRSSLSETATYLGRFDRRFLALAVLLFGVDVLISGARIWIFARKVDPRIPFGAAVRSCFANIFLGGITPSQTGGAAAQIYVLYREGLTLVDSTVVCFLGGFLGTSVVLMLCSFIFSVIVTPEFVGEPFRVASDVTLSLFTVVVGIVLVSLIRPNGVKRAIDWTAGRMGPLERALEKHDRKRRFFATIDRYHDLVTTFVVRNPLIVGGGLFLSALIYVNKFAIAYVVLRGLGLEAGFWDVMYMQVILILIFYFSPTPGASGLAEISTAAIMGSVVPPGYQAVFILMWRFFTLVAGMIIGAFVIGRYLSGEQRRPRIASDYPD